MRKSSQLIELIDAIKFEFKIACLLSNLLYLRLEIPKYKDKKFNFKIKYAKKKVFALAPPVELHMSRNIESRRGVGVAIFLMGATEPDLRVLDGDGVRARIAADLLAEILGKKKIVSTFFTLYVCS
jgi:hypothetical protein